MAAKGVKVQAPQPVVMPSLKLRDMDEKNMHNLFLKNMAGLIEEIKNPSPCLNPWVATFIIEFPKTGQREIYNGVTINANFFYRFKKFSCCGKSLSSIYMGFL